MNSMRLPSSCDRCAPAATRCGARGFSLTEVLVVIGVIVVLIGLAVPAFRALSGSNSVEGATNVISSSLASARVEAIKLQRVYGIAFFRDAATGRVAVAMVEDKDPDRDRLFITWVDGTDADPVDYSRGDYRSVGSSHYICLVSHTETTANNIPITNTSYWQPLVNAEVNGLAADVAILDFLPDTNQALLPVGVDLRGAGNRVTISAQNYDYFTPAVILFDANGSLFTSEYRLLSKGDLARQIAPSSVSPVSVPPQDYVEGTSQIGLMVFDDELAKNDGPTNAWIANNGTPLLVNRYNGTIVKGE